MKGKNNMDLDRDGEKEVDPRYFLNVQSIGLKGHSWVWEVTEK